jgi:hypothetical protein
MHLMSKVVGAKLLAAAGVLGMIGWLSFDGEASAQVKTTTSKSFQGTPPQGNHHHHPHLYKALHELKEARHNLKEAHGEFGGHREEALEAVHRAIHQVERAIEYSNHHHRNGNTNFTGKGKTIGTTPVK